jgi:hypothetical protein
VFGIVTGLAACFQSVIDMTEISFDRDNGVRVDKEAVIDKKSYLERFCWRRAAEGRTRGSLKTEATFVRWIYRRNCLRRWLTSSSSVMRDGDGVFVLFVQQAPART